MHNKNIQTICVLTALLHSWAFNLTLELLLPFPHTSLTLLSNEIASSLKVWSVGCVLFSEHAEHLPQILLLKQSTDLQKSKAQTCIFTDLATMLMG